MPYLSKKNSPQKTKHPPTVLVILDGWGIAPPGKRNAITTARTPTMDRLWKQYPHTMLYAHGSQVGLPEDQVGNSEAGHLNIGAGRIVVQDSVYILKSIKDGTFFKNPAFLAAIHHAKRHKSKLHLMGILSGRQCPHMSPDHVVALSKLGSQHKVKFLLHFFTDGRDSAPNTALELWQSLEKQLEPDVCAVASVSGRLYLDRKKLWKRTEQIYNALVLGQAPFEASSLEGAITAAYKRGETDEFISPTLIRNKAVTSRDNISDNDSIIFYNLRSDRARQLTKPFVQNEFEKRNQYSFNRTKVLNSIRFVTMGDFGPDLGRVLCAFPSRDVPKSLPTALGKEYRQLYVSEGEKYAHVTYFFNGGYSEPVAGEHRIMASSKDVESYREAPEMSAKEITDLVLEVLKQKWYDFICINYPNADMLGHTGNREAAVAGCVVVDRSLGRLLKQVSADKGTLLITADHGNAECIDEDNTMHESNPVPFIIYTDKAFTLRGQKEEMVGGKLGDIAPTLLELLGIAKPTEMTGESLMVTHSGVSTR